MKRILIVDDANIVRTFHRNVLESAGYAIEEAINGLEAIEKLYESSFDLLLVDINMPKLDGVGFLRQVRSNDGRQPPAIVVTTEAGRHDARLAYAAGANLFLVKPARPDVLMTNCRLLLGDVIQ